MFESDSTVFKLMCYVLIVLFAIAVYVLICATPLNSTTVQRHY